MRSGDYIEKLREWQKSYFCSLLSAHNGVIAQASKAAGMHKAHVRELLISLGIDYKAFRSHSSAQGKEISN